MLYLFIQSMLFLAAAGLMACTIAASLGRTYWMCELATHFRVQYAALFLLSALGFLLLHNPVSAAIAALGSMVNLAAILPAYGRMTLPFAIKEQPRGKTIKALLLNVNFRNQNYAKTLDYIRLVKPDLVAIVEVNAAWSKQLESLRPVYPFIVGFRGCRGWGLMLLSRLPLEKTVIVKPRARRIPYVRAEVLVDGRPIAVIVTHPYAPVTKRYAAHRNRQFEQLAAVALEQTAPVILLGDLNVSPWSPNFKQLLKSSRLVDSRSGFGVQPTWPTSNRWLQIPIDHCLVSSSVTVRDHRIGPDVGSDHLPVMVNIQLPNSY